MTIALSRRAALSITTGAAGVAVLPRRSWARDEAARNAALADAVDAYVRRCMAAFPDQPGLGVSLVRGGETVLARGYGVRRQDRPDSRVDETTLFAVASNTKAVTAASLGMLVDAGEVKWDEPVRTYLPDLRLSDPVIGERITVRDLLSHRAGFGLGAGDLLFWPNSDRTRAEVMAAIPNVPIEHGFRAGYHYCNLMFVVAGEVIAAVSGQAWEDFVQARVLTPLGMADTVPLTSRADPARSALPHGRVGPPLRYQGGMTLLEESIAGIWNWDSAGAAGGFAASARDWTRWMKTQLAGGVAPSGARLWSEAVAREMWRPNVISGSSPGPTAELPGRSIASTYAMGWSVADYRGERMVTHGGGSPGGISATVLIPGREVGFAVFSNAEESYLLRALRSGIADIVMAEDRSFAAFDWIADGHRLLAESTERSLTAATEIDAKQAAGAPPGLPLEDYAGTWRDPWYGDIVISEREGGLWLDFTRSNALKGPLEPYDGETFRTRFPDRREEDVFITFQMDDGHAATATMKGVSPDIDFSYDYQDLRLTRV